MIPDEFSGRIRTGVLQTAPGLSKITGPVDRHKRTTPVNARQGLGRPINSRMTVRNVDFRPNPLFCGIFRGNGTQSKLQLRHDMIHQTWMPTGCARHFCRQNERSGFLFAVISSYLQNFSYLGRIRCGVSGTGHLGAAPELSMVSPELKVCRVPCPCDPRSASTMRPQSRLRVLLVPDHLQWITGEIAKRIAYHNEEWIEATICSGEVLKDLMDRCGSFPGEVDLVHFLTEWEAELHLPRFEGKVPCVITIHHLEDERFVPLLPRSDATMTVCRQWHDYLSKYQLNSNKLVMVPNGVDTDRFRPPAPGRARTVACAGRITAGCLRGRILREVDQ